MSDSTDTMTGWQFFMKAIGFSGKETEKKTENSHVRLLVMLSIFVLAALIVGGIPSAIAFHDHAAVVVAVMLGILLIGTFVYWMLFKAYYAIYLEERAESARLRAIIAATTDRRKVREVMGNMLSEGRELMAICAKDDPATLPQKEFDDWSARVEAVLLQEFDFSYVARFRNPGSGMPMVMSPCERDAHRTLWGWIRIRVMRLDEFLSEISRRETPHVIA
jgi:hypothetical protein